MNDNDTDSSSILLRKSRVFWNSNPCDGHDDVSARMAFRHNKEPWVPGLLAEVARHSNVLEVGCGQGTDALYCCRMISSDARYTAIDYSDASVNKARESAEAMAGKLNIVPSFSVDNAEALSFGSDTFDCVLSIGVLHHTPDIEKALEEIHRVVTRQGDIYITLYRTLSPKLIAAHALRGSAGLMDRVFKKENLLYEASKKLGTEHFLGTMLHECFGVPILRSYSKKGIAGLFRHFCVEYVKPIGMGLPNIGINKLVDRGYNPLGAEWLIKARKS